MLLKIFYYYFVVVFFVIFFLLFFGEFFADVLLARLKLQLVLHQRRLFSLCSLKIVKRNINFSPVFLRPFR